ncbi:uncharacterized protein C1orf127 homolog [Hoplias malabaricus]|uniref:uncharacterized protein C1orf127 homolog n=1 Tax=Hoplias malabaricus TaxID=27720 RepID=UPI003461BF45
MDLMLLKIFLFSLSFILPVNGNALHAHKRDWIDSSPAAIAEGDVECFSEYMELWIHRMRIEGLRLWLSSVLKIEVNLTSLESVNHHLSACGFGLHKYPDRNYIFRVMYTGCFVKLEHGHYVIALNLVKRISRFGGKTHNYVMKCPVVEAALNREYIQCDPDFIQVTRQMPLDSWNHELTWFLALRGSLVVALEDASLIQVNVDIQKPYITVQGRRNTVLSPVQVLQAEGQFLPLKLVSGYYAYSMEATCPNVVPQSPEDTVLHIYKRRMGLTKRGGYDNETLTVISVNINQTETFTWSDTSSFVQLIIPTAFIQKTKNCTDKENANHQQSVFRIDAVLSFKETNNSMLWTLENTSPCFDAKIPSGESESDSIATETEHTISKHTLAYSQTAVGPLFSTEAPNMDLKTTSQTTNGMLKSFVPTMPPYVTNTANMDTAPTQHLSITSLGARPEQSVHFSHVRETLLVTSDSSYPSATDNRITTTTESNFNKTSPFTPVPSFTRRFNTVFKWNLVTSPSSSEKVNTPPLESKRIIVAKTDSNISLNPQPASLKPLQLNQWHTQRSLSPPEPDGVWHSTDTNQTAQSHSAEVELTGL